MISKITNAPINLYFDVTPTGNILNRFSNDLQKLDQSLGSTFASVNTLAYQALRVLIIVGMANWYTIGIIPILLMIIVPLYKFMMKGYRECTRVESVTKSPLINLMNESLSGGCTIRAYGKQDEFI